MNVSERALTPALLAVLDARAANLVEARIILNVETEKVSSLTEEIIALPVDAATKHRLLAYCTHLLELNTEEGELERQAAGILDATIAALHGARTSGQRHPHTVKEMARKLRPALATIDVARKHVREAEASAVRTVATAMSHHHTLATRGEEVARQTVDELIDAVPRHQLLTPSVCNALGPNRYALLEELVAERQATDVVA